MHHLSYANARADQQPALIRIRLPRYPEFPLSQDQRRLPRDSRAHSHKQGLRHLPDRKALILSPNEFFERRNRDPCSAAETRYPRTGSDVTEPDPTLSLAEQFVEADPMRQRVLQLVALLSCSTPVSDAGSVHTHPGIPTDFERYAPMAESSAGERIDSPSTLEGGGQTGLAEYPTARTAR